MNSTPATSNPTDQSRRTAVRALMILAAITVVLAVLTGVYLFTRPSFAGKWVGPGNVQGSGAPQAVVISLALDQNPLGGISGTGTVCAATNGTLTQLPVTVAGNLSGSSANLTLNATGDNPAVFPATLTANGILSQRQITLTATAPTHLLVTLQPGTASDFNAECQQLLQAP
jgi:hypothetical protein